MTGFNHNLRTIDHERVLRIVTRQAATTRHMSLSCNIPINQSINQFASSYSNSACYMGPNAVIKVLLKVVPHLWWLGLAVMAFDDIISKTLLR